MDDLLREFLTESGESLTRLDVELVQLEQKPNDQELLGNIFRLVHTVKGTCGFLGLPRLEAVAHAGENVLGRIREGKLTVNAQAITLILTSIDCIKSILSEIERTEAEPPGDDAVLIAQLNAFAEGTSVAPESAKAATVAAAPVEIAPVVSVQSDVTPSAPAATVSVAPTAAAPAAAAATAAVSGGEANQTIRVNVGLLENLMNLVSELVLTRNQLLQMVRGRNDSELSVPLQRLSHTTTELQEGVMKTRMQPIGNAWNQLPRIVRDLARDLGKEINLEMHGAETELDRQVLELIKDPLTHMVRNSADHGLEGPEDRRAVGKPETGRILLEAFHEGGHIIVKISDDGRGLALRRIKEKALEKGLATESELTQMSEGQIQQLIFKPGFSTAEKITNVSGRGVGMDVVRTNIEKIGGTIELKSVEGKGSTFVIKIPLTLAIVSALIVECGSERFAIPQINVVELVRAGEKSDRAIEKINGTPVLRLREKLLPLVSLRHLLRLDGTAEKEPAEAFIIVAAVGNQHFGIIVDRVFDTEEIVVKPVAPILRDISLYSGNTILGDGSVVMILDPNGIASESGATEIGEERGAEEAHVAGPGEDRSAILLFRAGGTAPKAVPLALVARLEEIDVNAIERSNGMPVVQYRGQLMPLVMVNATATIRSEGRQPVVVFTDEDYSMGLVVDEITDIVEDHMALELSCDTPGTIGSAVIAGKATEVIDVAHYMGHIHGGWHKAGAVSGQNKRILLVDDSPFSRNLLAPLLSVAGYSVTAVESAEEALKLRDHGETFDVIVSDIEMPGLDGCEFAHQVRAGGAWQETPLVALAANAVDLKRGQAAGFNDLAAKFDREAIVAKVSQTLLNLPGAA